MIGRKKRKAVEEDTGPKGFDDYDVSLGDLMRGERATLGKSLLDVQRELRIRASYISAIENADPTAFETPGFIAGYVRSYARYLGMSPEDTFDKFCKESGFQTAHGMAAEASTMRKSEQTVISQSNPDPFKGSKGPYLPEKESMLANLEPRAIASSLVLLALIAGVGYGGVSVVNEIQQVRIVPVEQTPVVLSDLDPLTSEEAGDTFAMAEATGVFNPPSQDLDRLYRPQALDVPVLVARDAPISTLNPQSVGAFTPEETVLATADLYQPEVPAVPQVVEDTPPEVVLFAVRPSWMSIKSADGSVLFENTLNSGDEVLLPASETAPTLKVAGMSGFVYVRIDGEIYGPIGEGSTVQRDVALNVDAITSAYQIADLTADPELARVASLITPTGELTVSE
ncbi:helix-turn-helix domain-containing protein [Cognatishimia sp.]|uniref:helix-turn-helix domain-containing protein n=1 Tax=Cognatishimia sp. TaxID=2211648 RepID=UPI003519A622